jgi:hypothetical protein
MKSRAFAINVNTVNSVYFGEVKSEKVDGRRFAAKKAIVPGDEGRAEAQCRRAKHKPERPSPSDH